MKTLDERLLLLRKADRSRPLRIMIIGLGSVGNYLLDYLLSAADENMELFVVGRSREKLESDVNISKVSAMIRGQLRSRITIIDGIDLEDVSSIKQCIETAEPDIIINSSRAYPGLKYGSISWANVRAYGIWTPLSIRFVKNIMEAYEEAGSDAVVINTSYSDAVIPWLKSAGKAYPDFGSGNVNHLIPRIRLALAHEYEISDPWNIDITFAVSHFHDVVISKEGQSEGIDMLIDMRYKGKQLTPDMTAILSRCNILTPADQKRNKMNASSDYELIADIIDSVRHNTIKKVHTPGFDGNIGGYPVMLDGSDEKPRAYVCEEHFTMEEMVAKNRESIYLDGVEDVKEGTLYYTDELIAKTEKAFGVTLPKAVAFDEIDDAAQLIIDRIIIPNTK